MYDNDEVPGFSEIESAVNESMNHNTIVRVDVTDVKEAVRQITDAYTALNIEYVYTEAGADIWAEDESEEAQEHGMLWRLNLVERVE